MHAGDFVPSVPWALPFVGMLLAIAVLPLAAPRFWESNLRKLGVAAALGAPVLVLYLRAHPAALVHTVVFFIFVVSNVGGCLTPLGDPPLFLGYLGAVAFLGAPWRELAILDNAPTYLTFLALGQGLGLPADVVGVPHATLLLPVFVLVTLVFFRP